MGICVGMQCTGEGGGQVLHVERRWVGGHGPCVAHSMVDLCMTTTMWRLPQSWYVSMRMDGDMRLVDRRTSKTSIPPIQSIPAQATPQHSPQPCLHHHLPNLALESLLQKSKQ